MKKHPVSRYHTNLHCLDQVCKKSLEGKMVTLDSENKPYCTKVLTRDYIFTTFDNMFSMQDYTKMFSVVCAGCKKAITPKKGQVYMIQYQTVVSRSTNCLMNSNIEHSL